MSILHTEDHIIGGRKYTIGLLPLVSGRKAFQRLGPILAMFVDEVAAETGGLSPSTFAALAGRLSAEDIESYCKMFGDITQVELDGDRVVSLGGRDGEKHQNEVFAGKYEDLMEWIDTCIRVNFGGVIAKTQGVLKSKAAARPAETAAENQSLKG